MGNGYSAFAEVQSLAHAVTTMSAAPRLGAFWAWANSSRRIGQFEPLFRRAG